MSLRVVGNNIILTRGDALYVKIVLEYSDNAETYELEDGDTVDFAIMDYNCQNVLVQKSVDNDSLLFKISPSDTEGLSENMIYNHGVKITKANGDRFTVLFGTLKLLPEVVP